MAAVEGSCSGESLFWEAEMRAAAAGDVRKVRSLSLLWCTSGLRSGADVLTAFP